MSSNFPDKVEQQYLNPWKIESRKLINYSNLKPQDIVYIYLAYIKDSKSLHNKMTAIWKSLIKPFPIPNTC